LTRHCTNKKKHLHRFYQIFPRETFVQMWQRPAKNCVKYTRLFRLAIFLGLACVQVSPPPPAPLRTEWRRRARLCVYIIVAVKVRALLIETRCLICSSSTVGLENLPSSNHRLKVNGKKEKHCDAPLWRWWTYFRFTCHLSFTIKIRLQLNTRIMWKIDSPFTYINFWGKQITAHGIIIWKKKMDSFWLYIYLYIFRWRYLVFYILHPCDCTIILIVTNNTVITSTSLNMSVLVTWKKQSLFSYLHNSLSLSLSAYIL
jgi:hypothetical protein